MTVRERPPLSVSDQWRPVRYLASAGWALIFAVSIYKSGLPLERNSLMAWFGAGLLCASIGKRPLWTVVADWVPFAFVLVAYDYARGAATSVGLPTWWHPQIDFDKFLFGGTEPTVWLQDHLRRSTVQWWDVVATLVYSSFFVMPYLVAGIFWLRSRAEFRRWVGRYVAVSFLGVVGFVCFPAAPPWAAARCTAARVANHPSSPTCLGFDPRTVPHYGLLGSGPDRIDWQAAFSSLGGGGFVERISTRGWGPLHLKFAQNLVDEGQGTVDFVAAVPSLHAALTMLLTVFLWRRAPWWGRVLLVAYPLAMTFALVYTAEHYVFDILIGFALALLVHLAANRCERWLKVRRDLDRLSPPKPTASRMENTQWPPTETTPSSTSASVGGSSFPPARSTGEPAPPGTTVPSASS